MTMKEAFFSFGKKRKKRSFNIAVPPSGIEESAPCCALVHDSEQTCPTMYASPYSNLMELAVHGVTETIPGETVPPVELFQLGWQALHRSLH